MENEKIKRQFYANEILFVILIRVFSRNSFVEQVAKMQGISFCKVTQEVCDIWKFLNF